MRALTIRLADAKYLRLKQLAARRKTSVNRLMDEMATLVLAEFDAKTRFLLRAQRGRSKTARGLELLEKSKG